MNPAPGPALEAVSLTHGYGSTPILRGLDFTVGAGEIYALLGGNGAGKSTTLGLFLGLLALGAGFRGLR